MDTHLIEAITDMIVKKLEQRKEEGNTTLSTVADRREEDKESKHKSKLIKVWDHLQPANQLVKNQEKLYSLDLEEPMLAEPQTRLGVSNPSSLDYINESIKTTPARIGIGRAGLRPKTEAWLRFRLDHAAAVDAVYGQVNQELLQKLGLFSVQTMITNKEEYIRRPDLGRRVNEEGQAVIKERCLHQPQVQIIIADGLSSQAVEKNVEDVYLSCQQALNSMGFKQGTPFFIHYGRVAVMDHIGEILQPEVVILLLGERPGLVSAESLSAYLCYKPRMGTIEADRMVISNIHSQGIPPVEAGAYLGTVVKKIIEHRASGVTLVQKENG